MIAASFVSRNSVRPRTISLASAYPSVAVRLLSHAGRQRREATMSPRASQGSGAA